MIDKNQTKKNKKNNIESDSQNCHVEQTAIETAISNRKKPEKFQIAVYSAYSHSSKVSVGRSYTVSPEKTEQNCFCQNFLKFAPASKIFGKKMAKYALCTHFPPQPICVNALRC